MSFCSASFVQRRQLSQLHTPQSKAVCPRPTVPSISDQSASPPTNVAYMYMYVYVHACKRDLHGHIHVKVHVHEYAPVHVHVHVYMYVQVVTHTLYFTDSFSLCFKLFPHLTTEPHVRKKWFIWSLGLRNVQLEASVSVCEVVCVCVCVEGGGRLKKGLICNKQKKNECMCTCVHIYMYTYIYMHFTCTVGEGIKLRYRYT